MLLPEERACYIDLLIYQHQHGIIPSDLKRVLMYCSGVDKATLEATLKAKFEQTENGWINQRLEKAVLERENYKNKQSLSGKIGQFWKKAYKLLSKSDAGRLKKQMTDDLIISFLNENDIKDESTLKGLLQGLLKQRLSNKADVDVNVIEDIEKGVTGEKTKKADFQKFVEDFNLLRKSKFRANKQLEQKFYQRISEGYTPDDILNALKIALQDEFHKNSEYRYITVEFMLRYDKLDKFLNTKINGNSQKHNSGSNRPTTEELNAAVEAGIALASAAHNG